MITMFAMFLQSKTAVVPPPVYSDNATILHHMSDALHQSLYRVLSLLIAMPPGHPGLLRRVDSIYPDRDGDLRAPSPRAGHGSRPTNVMRARGWPPTGRRRVRPPKSWPAVRSGPASCSAC